MDRIKKDQSILIVRYTTKIQSDCIEQHIRCIEKNGECWFGMLGAIANKTKELIMQVESPFIILYKRGKCYLCELGDISEKKPENGYPDYYEEVLFMREIYPKTYLKLLSIKEISVDNLNNLFVLSTGKTAISTLNSSMASMIIASKEEPVKEKTSLGVNECLFRKDDNTCGNKRCINFEYVCESPSRCAKQKR